MSLAVLKPGGDGATALYIVAFSLFILGVKQGTHPTTAKRGNMVAAVGMAVAVVTTLLLDGIGNWGLIALGLGIGTAVGVIASIRVQMTEMPQMVALYNGVGGGAVALIAWSEIRHGISLGEEIPLDTLIPVLFAAVVGSVSFWGSNIAFAKLQDLIPTRPLSVPGQQVVNALLLIGILAACIDIAANNGDPSQAIFIGVLIAAAVLGNLVVLPIGGADMPVVISLLNAFTGPLRGGRGLRARQRRPDRRRHPGRLLGNDPDDGDGDGDEPLGRQRPLRRLRRRARAAAPAGATEERPHVSIGAQDAAIKLAYADSVVIVPGYGLAVAQAQHAIKEVADQLEKRGVTRQLRDPSRRRPDAGPHERPPRRGRRALRAAEGDGGDQPGDVAHRRRRRRRRQRRHQPGGQERPRQPDRRDADHRSRPGPAGDRDQALAQPRLRRHRQRPLLRAEHLDAVRRRQAGRGGHRRRDREPLAAASAAAGGGRPPPRMHLRTYGWPGLTRHRSGGSRRSSGSGLLLAVALLLAALLAVGVRVPGVALARAVASRILCAAALGDSCGDEPALIAAYGTEVGELVRRHMPTIAFEDGSRAVPVDFRRCRSTSCGDAAEDGRSAAPTARPAGDRLRPRRRLPARGRRSGTEAAGADCSGERAGNLYIQYWTYYADSATLRGMPVVGERATTATTGRGPDPHRARRRGRRARHLPQRLQLLAQDSTGARTRGSARSGTSPKLDARAAERLGPGDPPAARLRRQPRRQRRRRMNARPLHPRPPRPPDPARADRRRRRPRSFAIYPPWRKPSGATPRPRARIERREASPPWQGTPSTAWDGPRVSPACR